ncbi:MAG: hypothetical protein ACI4JY_07740 [Oscillospiraceae bacterium]
MERYCISMRIVKKPILSITDIDVIKDIIGKLEKNRSFRIRFKRNLSKIDSFLKLYIQFLKNNPDLSVQAVTLPEKHNTGVAKKVNNTERITSPNDSLSGVSEEEKARLNAILEKHFKEDGYQLGRAIFRGRFRTYYTGEYGVELEYTNEKLEDILRAVGDLRDGRVFPKGGSNQNLLLEEMLSDIVSAFDSGATAVYSSAVYERYRERLAAELHIYTEESVTDLLQASLGDKFDRFHSHFVIRGRESNPSLDIRRLLRDSHLPLTVDEIHNSLWYIPIDKTKFLLAADSSLVSVATATYYYAPNFPINESEKRILISAIGSQLDFAGYMTDVELMNIIGEKCPNLAINAAEFSRYGMRNCLGYILKEHFSFNGPIITRQGCEINRNDVFGRFAKERERMSFDELKAFADDMETQIYWDAVMSETVRLSENEFVRKDEIDFDISAIDEHLGEICTGEYLPINEINLFLSFPGIGYQWNSFVLESYLFNFSRKFRLVHTSFARKDACGAMVRAESPICDYDSLITDVLSKAGREFSEKSALDYLVENGYQAKRSYRGIESILRNVNRKPVKPK